MSLTPEQRANWARLAKSTKPHELAELRHDATDAIPMLLSALDEAERKAADLERQLAEVADGCVCMDCGGTGWLENREEGKHPCTCMTEAEPYQLLEEELAATLKQLAEAQARDLALRHWVADHMEPLGHTRAFSEQVAGVGVYATPELDAAIAAAVEPYKLEAQCMREELTSALLKAKEFVSRKLCGTCRVEFPNEDHVPCCYCTPPHCKSMGGPNNQWQPDAATASVIDVIDAALAAQQANGCCGDGCKERGSCRHADESPEQSKAAKGGE